MKRLIVNDVELDVSENISLPITYQIFDVNEINGRKKSLSKQSFLKGTAKNIEFFNGNFDLQMEELGTTNIGFKFDTLKKAKAKLFNESSLIFEGFFSLDYVERTGEDIKIFFTLFSIEVDFIKDLSNIDLKELDFSEYNHILNFNNVTNSLNTSVIKNGVATNNFTAAIPEGFGYLYGLIDYGYLRPAHNNFSLSDILPQFYLREIIIKMFERIGIEIDFPLIDEPFFKRIVVGNGNGVKVTISNAEILSRRIFWDYLQVFIFTKTTSTPFKINGNILNFSISSVFSIIDTNNGGMDNISDASSQIFTDKIIIKKSGTYKIEAHTGLRRGVGVGSGMTILGVSPVADANFVIKKNGSTIYLKKHTVISGGGSPPENVNTLTASFLAGDVIEISIEAPEVIVIVNHNNVPVASRFAFLNYEINSHSGTHNGGIASIEVTAIRTELVNGDVVEVNAFLPKMKCEELFSSVVKMFNLFFDFNSDGVLRIMPFDDFYLDTANTENWSKKVDYSRKQRITSANLIPAKSIVYKYKDDKDFFNELYLNETGRNYGDNTINIGSQRSVNTVVYELGFSPTVNVQKQNETIILPTILLVDNGIQKPYNGNVRIFFYQGLRNGTVIIDGNVMAQYAQLGNFDNIDNPTMDLHFAILDKHYYALSSTTNNNIFNINHSKFLKELSSKKSRKLETNIILNSLDIENLNFSKLKNIDGSIYRLSSIKDVDTDVDNSFTAEFIRVLEAENQEIITTITEFPSNPNISVDNDKIRTTTILIEADITVTNDYDVWIITSVVQVIMGMTLLNTIVTIINNNTLSLKVLRPNFTLLKTIPAGGTTTVFFDGTNYF